MAQLYAHTIQITHLLGFEQLYDIIQFKTAMLLAIYGGLDDLGHQTILRFLQKNHRYEIKDLELMFLF